MREVDTLKMKRRQLEVEINRIKDKLRIKEEEKKDYNMRIITLVNEDPSNSKSFTSISSVIN